MHTLRRTAATTAVAALTVLALAAGCGEDDGSGGATSGSAAGEGGGELEELEAGDFYATVMDAQEEAGSYRYTVSTGSAGQTTELAGEARYADDGTLEMTGSGEGMEMVVVDGVFYLKAAGMDLGDAQWFALDTKDPAAAGGLFGSLTALGDPDMMLGAMEDPESFELVGEEEVDGVATNHYRIGVDSATYTEKLGLPAEVTSMFPETIEFDMWVDAEDLPRKFSQSIEVGGQPSATEGTYSDYGVDVVVEAPPAEDVTEEMPTLPGMPG
jgi:hypothetical protein